MPVVSPVAALVSAGSTDETPVVKTVNMPRPPVPITQERVGEGGRRLWMIGLPITLDGSPGRVLDAAVGAPDLAASRRMLAALDGAFAAFLWDARERRLIVVNDCAGFQPLYMRRTRGAVAFAPRIDALAGEARPDASGWGAFVGFGHSVGERTSVEGITRVPPASIIEYEAGPDRLSMTQYWQWPSISPDLTLDTVDTGELLSLLDADIRAYGVYGGAAPLLLSGGFESRLMAALLTRAGQPPTALTLRNPYEHLEIDGRFAARVARELGLRHEIRDPDPDFFSTATYLQYVRAHEVASTSVNLFIAQVASELQASGAQATWDGFPFGSIVKEKSAESFEAFLGRTMKPFDGPEWQAAGQVFTRGFAADMREGLEQAIRQEIDACHPAPHGTQQFFHRNRIRHRIAPNTLKVYSTFLLPFLPGLTKAFYERVVPIAPAVRAGEALYHRIFERHFRPLARLPWASGGHLTPGTQKGVGYRALAARSAVLEHPRIGPLLRRARLAPARPRSTYVDEAVRHAPVDDGFLNADGIRALQQTPPTGTNADSFARELVFYWSMWRAVMNDAAAAE